MTNFSNKKILYALICFLVVVLFGGIYFARYSKDKTTYSQNLPQIQKDILSTFKDQKGYTINLSEPGNDKIIAKLSGSLIPSGNFQGQYELSVTDDKNEQSIAAERISIIKIGNDVYTKNDKDASYQKNENAKMFAYELGILAHPEDIQIRKRLSDQTIDGVVHLQYEAIFEDRSEENQNIVKTMSQEELDNLQLRGIVLVRKDNFLLKQMKLHQGKDDKNSFTIDYNVTKDMPKIEAPNI